MKLTIWVAKFSLPGVCHGDDVQTLVELKGYREAGVIKDGIRLHPKDPLELFFCVCCKDLPQDAHLIPASFLSIRLMLRIGKASEVPQKASPFPMADFGVAMFISVVHSPLCSITDRLIGTDILGQGIKVTDNAAFADSKTQPPRTLLLDIRLLQACRYSSPTMM